MLTIPNQKLVLMGLGESGKSSIKAIVFEGRKPNDVSGYRATINYVRSTKTCIDSDFQVIDCGGQESFISNFVNEKASFIFSDVKVLVWVVDIANFSQVSTSKYYFDLAVKNLHEYSSNSKIYCLFHKIDLIIPEKRAAVADSLKKYFVPQQPIEIKHFPTSIFDRSIYDVFGEIIQQFIKKSSKAQNITELVQEYVTNDSTLAGITIYSEDGLPIIEEGTMTDKLIVPANLWLTNFERLKTEIEQSEKLKGVIETDNYIFIFQRMKNELLFTGIARKIKDIPLQYVLVKIDELSEKIKKIM